MNLLQSADFLQTKGFRLPTTDPVELLRQIRIRNYVRAEGLSEPEAVQLGAQFDPGPEYD